MLRFNEYQWSAQTTALYKGQGEFMGLTYATLGLSGESGEVADEVKKAWRNDGDVTDERKARIAEELGDVLWYVAAVCNELDLTMDDIASANLIKLHDRKKEDKLKVHD